MLVFLKVLEIIPFHSSNLPSNMLFQISCLYKEGSGGQKQKKSATKAKTFPLKFDFSNVPEKVQWVLTDFSKGSWAPFTGDKKVPQTTVQEWEAAFTAFSSKNNGQKLIWKAFPNLPVVSLRMPSNTDQ